MATAQRPHTDWRYVSLPFAGVLLLIFIAYFETLSSILAIWGSTDAYLHGYLILPISVGLIWLQRSTLADSRVSTSLLGVVVLVLLSALWLLSDLAGIQFTAQFSVVAMIPAAVLCLFGWEVFRSIRFALLYLLFAVPFGDFLIPYLIDFTAAFCVDMLNILGIPVFRDGRFFRIPSGSYEVAKACSGLQYFIATFALTTLYSYSLFHGTLKRVLFVGVALVLALLANGIRATSVVLILHYSDFDIAAGEDHEFVGWIVFALMILILIWMGQRFQDGKDDQPAVAASSNGAYESDVDSAPTRSMPLWSASVLAAAAVALGPVLAPASEAVVPRAGTELARLPVELDSWLATEAADTAWQPKYRGFSDMTLGSYRHAGGETVDVALVRYVSQHQGAEVSSAANEVIDTETWIIENIFPMSMQVGGGDVLQLREVGVRRPGETRLIWHWIDVNGKAVGGVLQTKLFELRNLISGKASVSTAVIVSSPNVRSPERTRELLEQFLQSFHEALKGCLQPIAELAKCAHGRSVYEEG